MRNIEAEKEEGAVKELANPRRPNGKEVEKHMRTRMPYRNWCNICVRAKGRDWAQGKK